MTKLVFDIETIGEEFDSIDEHTKELMTRWIKKESYNEAEYKSALDDLKDGLGFSPLTGQIVSIGVLDVEKNLGAVYFQSPNVKQDDFEEDGIKYKVLNEKGILEGFWDGAKNYSQLITFNGRPFDVPFMMVRSAIHELRPSVNLMPPRYQSNPVHIDLLDQLSFFGTVRRKGNLHMWTRAFGIKSPKEEGVSGDDVGGLFKNKEFLKIAKYNARDLYATRDLYNYWDKYIRF